MALSALRLAAQPMVLDSTFAPRVDSGESIAASAKYASGLSGQVLVFGFGYSDRFYVDEVRPEHALARLLPDGKVDASFARPIDPSIDETVQSAVTLPDGRILVSTRVGSSPPASSRVVRLLASGQADPTFAPSTFAGDSHVALQSDGGAIAWGNLGSGRRIVRLLADGSVDASFKEPNFVGGMYGSPEVVSLVITLDDSLVIVLLTHTTRFFGYELHRIKRTGELDGSFVPPDIFEGGTVVAGLSDNRVLVQFAGGCCG